MYKLYKQWGKYRKDIVSLCKVVSTILLTATFFGFSVNEQVASISPESSPIVEGQVETENFLK